MPAYVPITVAQGFTAATDLVAIVKDGTYKDKMQDVGCDASTVAGAASLALLSNKAPAPGPVIAKGLPITSPQHAKFTECHAAMQTIVDRASPKAEGSADAAAVIDLPVVVRLLLSSAIAALEAWLGLTDPSPKNQAKPV